MFSVAQAGLTPVLVDVDPDTLSLSGQFEEPVLAIHMLGNPARVETPWLLEDSLRHCAEVDGKKQGPLVIVGPFLSSSVITLRLVRAVRSPLTIGT